MSAFEISYILLWLIGAILLVAVVGLYSAFGAIYADISKGKAPRTATVFGPPVGERVQIPEVVDIAGDPIDGVAHRWLFASISCQPCLALKAALGDMEAGELPGATVLVCSGNRDEVAVWGEDVPEWVRLVADEDALIFRRFNVTATPIYVGLDQHGTCIATGPASDRRALDRQEARLVAHLEHDSLRV
jgi:hypothetical protein